MRLLQAREHLRWKPGRLEMSYGALFFVAAAALLWYSYRYASTTILRQQLKWVTRGTILAIAPYTLFYVIPYLMGSLPGPGMKVSVLSLGLLPLTSVMPSSAIALMDVDLIFKRGVVYTLAASRRGGNVFRAGCWRCGTGPHAATQQRSSRADSRRRGDCLAV